MASPPNSQAKGRSYIHAGTKCTLVMPLRPLGAACESIQSYGSVSMAALSGLKGEGHMISTGRFRCGWVSVGSALIVRLGATCLLAGAVLLLPAGQSMGHHSMAVFDKDQWFTMTGVLDELDFRNPHIFLHVAIDNEAGDSETWMFEGPATGMLRAVGYFKSDFEASLGLSVTIEASPARDGSNNALIRQLTLASGDVISACPQYC